MRTLLFFCVMGMNVVCFANEQSKFLDALVSRVSTHDLRKYYSWADSVKAGQCGFERKDDHWYLINDSNQLIGDYYYLNVSVRGGCYIDDIVLCICDSTIFYAAREEAGCEC